jgi:hypothetical protein
MDSTVLYNSPLPPLSDRDCSPLRQCWPDLSDPRLQIADDTSFSAELHQQHAAALGQMDIRGLEEAVADEIEIEARANNRSEMM